MYEPTDKANRNYCKDKLSDADMKAGFKNREMDPFANMATNEHNTVFYDEVTRTDKLTGKKTKGILERGNFLDRL